MIPSHKIEIKGCGLGGLRTGVEIVQVDNLMSRWYDGNITQTGFFDGRLKTEDFLILEYGCLSVSVRHQKTPWLTHYLTANTLSKS